MNKYSVPIWTTLALLLAGPVAADHCAPHIAASQQALEQLSGIETNAADAVTALLPAALQACRLEEQSLPLADAPAPADQVTVGQSMLINITGLLYGE
jgi:hypothetical protein